MNLYLITREEAHMKEIMDHLNFEIVLVGRGHFPENTCIWMGWQAKDDDSNEKLYDKLNAKFGLENLGIQPIRSTLFPENLIWDNAYGDILIFGSAEELKTYIHNFSVFSADGKPDDSHFPEAFIYKMVCEVTETAGTDGRSNRSLKVLSRGFLYESDGE